MISIGVIGFGRTSSLVCDEVIKDPELSLSWVLRKTKSEQFFSSSKLGHKTNSGKFYSQIVSAISHRSLFNGICS